MTRRQIERFLAVLATQLDEAGAAPARVFMTGAAAAALWGRVRPSLDIDFGLELRGKARGPGSWARVEAAVNRTTRLTGIPASAAEDIDRWGMITLLDYQRTSRPYRRWGKLEVRLLHPANWAIGKLTRYLDPDIRDVVEVFRRQEVTAAVAADRWGRALRASPSSTAQFQFRGNVETFFRRHGRATWGAGFDAPRAIRQFHRAAAIHDGAPG
jgi:hypothetical protein